MFENYTDAVKDRESAIEEVSRFLSMSIKAIDKVFTEDGFAKRNPQLLATFLQTAVLDFHATQFGELLEFIDGHLAVSGESLTGIKDEIPRIADGLSNLST